MRRSAVSVVSPVSVAGAVSACVSPSNGRTFTSLFVSAHADNRPAKSPSSPHVAILPRPWRRAPDPEARRVIPPKQPDAEGRGDPRSSLRKQRRCRTPRWRDPESRHDDRRLEGTHPTYSSPPRPHNVLLPAICLPGAAPRVHHHPGEVAPQHGATGTDEDEVGRVPPSDHGATSTTGVVHGVPALGPRAPRRGPVCRVTGACDKRAATGTVTTPAPLRRGSPPDDACTWDRAIAGACLARPAIGRPRPLWGDAGEGRGKRGILQTWWAARSFCSRCSPPGAPHHRTKMLATLQGAIV